MAQKGYIWAIGIATMLMFGVWSAIVFAINPEESGWPSVALFYFSALLWLSGLFSLLGLLGRTFLADKDGDFQIELAVYLRRGFLIGVFLVAMLLLKQFGWFAWWDALLFFAGILIWELYFLGK